MDLLLNNKKVLVSGSTTGIGYAIAKGFAKEGALVYVNGRSEKMWQKPLVELKAKSRKQRFLELPPT